MDRYQFSKREQDVVTLLLQGKSNKQIALELGISNRTVEFHLSNIYAKLGVASRTEAVLKLSETHLRESTGPDENPDQVKSTVEEIRESSENNVKPNLRRFPMKTLFYFIVGGLLATLLAVIYLLANSPANNSPILPTPSPTPAPTPSPIPTQVNNVSAESEIRDLVENFGKRLQNVSLLAPDAAQEIMDQYSEFVSPALIEIWMDDVSQAPGRMVSSPWPDRIDISTLSKLDSDKYEITGNVIEVTSVELVNGGAAARLPVRMVVQKDQGHWLITEYTQER